MVADLVCLIEVKDGWLIGWVEIVGFWVESGLNSWWLVAWEGRQGLRLEVLDKCD